MANCTMNAYQYQHRDQKVSAHFRQSFSFIIDISFSGLLPNSEQTQHRLAYKAQ